jgi:hypothetical protein
MRKRYRVSLLAALGAAFVAPLGFASFESVPAVAQKLNSAGSASTAYAATTPVVRHLRDAASASVPPQGFDAAGLLMVGTVLFGAAAVIRKAV